MGPTVALAPSLVLLVYGADANHVLLGNAFLDLSPLVLGITALTALERDDRLGDLAACALLVLAVATYSLGLAFVGGASIGQRPLLFLGALLIVVGVQLGTLGLLGQMIALTRREVRGEGRPDELVARTIGGKISAPDEMGSRASGSDSMMPPRVAK